MSCTVALTVAGAATVVTTAAGSPTVITSTGAPVVLQLRQTAFTIDAPAGPALVVEVARQGIPGPQGPQGIPGPVDLVCPEKLDSVLIYDAQDRLSQITYADGRVKLLTYDGAGLLVQVACENLDGDTVLKTLAYTDGLLTSVTSTVVP